MSDYKPLACLPVLPLRGIVVFPGCVTHFDVGRSRSARAVEEAMRADQMIFLVAQRDVQCDEPKKTDLYSVGTVAYVRQILRLPGDNMRILVEGKYRAQLTDMIHAEPYLFARAMELDEPGYHAAVPRTQALVRQAHQLFEQFIDLAVKSGQENLLQGSATDDAGALADYPLWVADYRASLGYNGAYTMWQYSGSGTVSGRPLPFSRPEKFSDATGILP